MGSSGKRKRGDYVPHLPPDGFIPQQDGACDVTVEFLLPEVLLTAHSIVSIIL